MKIENQLKHIQYRLAGLSNDERAFLINGDPQFHEGIKEKAKEVTSSFTSIKEMARTPEEKKRILDIEEGFNEHLNISQSVVALYHENKNKSLSLHFGDERDIRKKILDPKMNAYIDSLTKEIEDDTKRIKGDRDQFKYVLIILTVMTTILGSVFGVNIIVSIIKPLTHLNIQMKEIAEGEADLTKTIEVKNKDELGELAGSFNQFTSRLRSIIKALSETSSFITTTFSQFRTDDYDN